MCGYFSVPSDPPLLPALPRARGAGPGELPECASGPGGSHTLARGTHLPERGRGAEEEGGIFPGPLLPVWACASWGRAPHFGLAASSGLAPRPRGGRSPPGPQPRLTRPGPSPPSGLRTGHPLNPSFSLTHLEHAPPLPRASGGKTASCRDSGLALYR